MRMLLRGGLLFVLSGLVGFLMMDRLIRAYDEGIVLTGAMRVMAGDMPHRDFYANYGPGQFYLLAGLFRMFGTDVTVERWWDLAVRAGIVTMVYLLLSPRIRRPLSWGATLLCALWLWSVGSPSYPIYPALLCSLLATMLLERALERGSPAWAAGAGACVAGATLFRYDIGFFALVALLAGGLAARRLPDLRQLGMARRELLAMTLTAGAIVLLLLTLYAATGALGPFFHDVIAFPADAYAKYRSLPFPTAKELFRVSGLASMAVYLPLAAAAAAAFVLVRASEPSSSGRDTRGHRTLLALLLALTLMFYLQGVVRVDLEHVQLSLLVSIPLLAVALELAPLRSPRVAIGALAVANALSALVVTLYTVQKGTVVFHEAERVGAGVFKVRTGVSPARGAAIRFLIENSRPDERIFVGVGRHDKIFVNDVSAYFLAGRQPATRWHHFDPGLQTSQPVQQDIVRELEGSPPRLVMLDTTFDDMQEPNESARSSGVTVLDDYLVNHYELAGSFGPIVIVQRKR